MLEVPAEQPALRTPRRAASGFSLSRSFQAIFPGTGAVSRDGGTRAGSLPARLASSNAETGNGASMQAARSDRVGARDTFIVLLHRSRMDILPRCDCASIPKIIQIQVFFAAEKSQLKQI